MEDFDGIWCEMDGYTETADTEQYWHCEERAVTVIVSDGELIKVCAAHVEP